MKELILKEKSIITISAIPGIAGLNPILKLINHTKKILIANKEAIIFVWELIQKKAKKYKTKLINRLRALFYYETFRK